MKKNIVGCLLAATILCGVASPAYATSIDGKWFSANQAEIKAQIDEATERMSHAHTMAESARALGMDEGCEAIQTAKLIWHESEKETQELTLKLEQAKQPKAPSFELFQATGLNAEAFNLMLSGSGLAGHGADFVELENTYGINGVFAIAVAKVESGLGSSHLAMKKNNFFGMIGNSFSSDREGVLAFGRLMNKPVYHGKPLDVIARTYCPPTAVEWTSAVKACMSRYWNKLADN